MKQLSLWWIRRDLRLSDNQALQTALSSGGLVVPLFILDPALLFSASAAEKRKAFLFAGLRALDVALRQRGSTLVVRQGEPLDVLTSLMQEIRANRIYAERDFSPFAQRRDRLVGQKLPLVLVDGLTVHHPATILKADGSPYTIFTPYKRRWLELPIPGPESLVTAPAFIPTPSDIDSLPISDLPNSSVSALFPSGEDEGQRRLDAFSQGGREAPIYHYAERRNRMDLQGTSGLSPYLRFGLVSARQAVVAALQARSVVQNESAQEGAATWLSELIWREFYIAILAHFPRVLKESFRPAYRHIAWRNDPQHFLAWRQGRTGYPVVDAAMRQLAQCGWMHNRARMIVASFLVKDLLIDWHWGERYFMQQLVDGDPAANNGGWQWSAGTGTDAAPYFRIFNPVLQGKKFDPDGAFVRRWLPELANVPLKYLHQPWKMPASVQTRADCLIGPDYPAPIVDHAVTRQAALAAYAQAREAYSQGG